MQLVKVHRSPSGHCIFLKRFVGVNIPSYLYLSGGVPVLKVRRSSRASVTSQAGIRDPIIWQCLGEDTDYYPVRTRLDLKLASLLRWGMM